ncbi:MAG: HRDC domain-containing protein [Cardiobacteriaceae bacterium]|nr:HRDC domain-containing protein [Cardiobacteriaceae bacterium]
MSDRILCYDSEFVRERSFFPKLSLIQLCQPVCTAVLFDVLLQPDSVPWQMILSHPSPLVVHAGIQDLELMRLYGGGKPFVVRDTQVGFALCSSQMTVSYAALVAHFLGIYLDKSQTRSDWLLRPLSERQQAYAADDVGLLVRLYPLLVAELQRLGRLSWWAEECTFLLERQKEERAAWHWYRLQGAPSLCGSEKRVAQILTETRERLAELYDLPRREVLSDQQIIKIAKRRPQQVEAIAEDIGVNHMLWQDMAYLTQQFNEDSVLPSVPMSPRLSPNKRRFFEHLCQYTNDVASDLGIHPDMLASARLLKQFCAKPDSASRLLTGWRAAFFRDQLEKLL